MTHQKNNQAIDICQLNYEHIDAVVMLHQREINYGFSSYLGRNFLKYLYKTFIRCEYGFALVAADRNGQVTGFIAAATNLSKFYKRFLRKYSLIAGFLVLPKLFRWKAIKSLYQDLLYPSEEAQHDLPKAEIVSVAVSPNARGQGIGSLLTKTAFEEFRKRGVHKIKVLVGDRLQANEFYRKMGFGFVTHITYDSEKMDANVYVKDLMRDARDH
jgi:ribosomal protein S18 acetylase RimI-like enzyme